MICPASGCSNDRILVEADYIASCFHRAYEELAPRFGYETREASAVPWEDVPEPNKSLMTAVVASLLRDGVIS